MSVEYMVGNALDFPGGSNVLLHGCNTLGGVFGAGIAKQIAEEYPAALEADKEAAAAGANRLGLFSVAVLPNGKRITNGYTQADISTDRRQVDYEAVYVVLSETRAALETALSDGRRYTLCMPWIGCGLAGGSKRVIRAMIEDVFEESPIRCVVVERAVKPSAQPSSTTEGSAP